MKTRNDSMGSSSTTDRELPLNLSNLSTTPTFSNVMLPQNGTNDQPMSPAMMAKTTQSPNQDKVAQVTADGNGISSTQSISGYNYQPMHTFSFSRLTSSQMPSSIQLPSSIDANNLTAMTTNSSYNVPPTVDKALLNAQPFGMQSNAVGNRWGNMLFRAANTGPALVEKRSERGTRLSQRPPISPNPNTSMLLQPQVTPLVPSRIRNRPASSPLKEEYDADVTSVESTRETSSLHSTTSENPLSTGLLTLSIHEALTFDGVELALHPDVFVKEDGENKTRQQQQGNISNRGLKPGDLVEIRVWSVRPGVKVKSDNIASNSGSVIKSNTGGSNYHSRNPSLITLSSTSILSPGVGVPVKSTNNYHHSRNPSLATLSSASILSPGNIQVRGNGVYNTSSVVNTPQSSVAPENNVVNIMNAPPLPSIIGGNPSSPVPSPGVKDRKTPELRGEYLLENNPQSDTKTSATPGTSNLSSTVSTSLVGSTLPLDSLPSPPLISQKNKLSFSTIETDSVQGHSRDSSLVTSSSAMHSRENSLLSPNHSWLTTGSGAGNTPSPKDETVVAQGVSSSAALPSHPLAALSMQSPHPTSSKKGNLPIPPSSSDKRPPLPPSNDMNVSLLSEPGVEDKKQLDLITEETSPERIRASTSGSEDASHHKRSNSIILYPSGSNHALSSMLPKLTEDEGTASDDVEREGSNTMDEIQKTHFVRVSFVVPISERSLTSIKSGARTQVSLLRRVADLYNVTAFCPVTVTQVGKREEARVRRSNAADFITVTMKDQFVSRRDMYSFQKSFLNDWVYEGKRLSFDGIRTNAKVIRHGNHAIKSGIITEDTKITFRSRSARIIWLVQISSEMWDFASPYNIGASQKNPEPVCHIYFDKFVSFCRRLFGKWKKLDLTHNLTVIYFSRTYISRHESATEDFLPPSSWLKSTSPIHVDADGRYYEDHYKIVLENETRSDWESLIPIMKREFVNYPKGVKWNLSSGNERIPSSASQGNILESINITLNLLHLHYVDRDLHRTGNSIVVITSGNGVFEINKNLASITKQRMMDNGIGSDMLSLSLPPLHIAPFFLYKEKGTSSEEELQGFDDWKVFFEIPHWMNLSFVCYDDEEEPMLYKQNRSSELNSAKKEDDTASQLWQVSNGFLARTHDPTVSFKSFKGSTSNATANKYQHMISDRDFHSILQACRPRNRGESGSGLPLSLSTLIKKSVNHNNEVSKMNAGPRQRKGDSHQHNAIITPASPQRAISSRGRYQEWGAVNFERYDSKRLQDDAGSQSSHSSSFASCGSNALALQPSGLGHLQSSMYLDTAESDNSIPSTIATDVAAIKNFMSDYDTNVYSHPAEKQLGKSEAACNSPPLCSVRARGGIEAALEHYENPKRDEESGFPEPTGLVKSVSIKDNSVIISERSLAVSPLGSLVTPYSFDSRRPAMRPSTVRLLVPEALPSSGLRSEIPLGSRRKSFSVLHDSLREHVGSMNSKTPKNTLAKMPAHTPSSKQSARGERHSTQRRRRKQWVLNPFRQEDEDEVLAKRTHNRRRWSHVFPLGEEEFKRHAGPNWKSLCQPAILPMTIDFHPTAQELQDKERFRVKQYSVTLPSMNETNYKSHRELLDELVAQRIIQDYQIVPRAIVSSGRDVADKVLEHTLSMGHKIQQLSYNPSQDSVDVIQYYANFAENEVPQIYKYSLWSTLVQDYVNVAQTFTKYTSPYKWNEVDMLISGDSFTHILEGMRYPRISFVIIPDQFVNKAEEKEYASKFQRLVEYFIKLQPKDADKTQIDVHMTDDSKPKGSKEDRRFIVDLRKRNDEKYEWAEMVHDSNCDTRRTFRITIQWLVAVSAKIDQQAQLLQRRCTQFGLKLVSVPHYSALRSCFLNPFVVPLTTPIKNKKTVDMLEVALTERFGFVFDGTHLSDPNEIEANVTLEEFDFAVNKWSIKKRKKVVPANQYLHRSGTLFCRFLRDQKDAAILITFLNTRHSTSDELRSIARRSYHDVQTFISRTSVE